MHPDGPKNLTSLGFSGSESNPPHTQFDWFLEFRDVVFVECPRAAYLELKAVDALMDALLHPDGPKMINTLAFVGQLVGTDWFDLV